MKKIVATLIISVVGVVMFYACTKDNSDSLTNNPGPRSAEKGLLINPMEQYGIWHNQCLEYMFTLPNANELTKDELWVEYGDPFLQERLNDTTPISLASYNATFAKVSSAIKKKNAASLIGELVKSGKLDKDFTSPYITENNYTLLHELFSYYDKTNIDTKEKNLLLLDVIKECEQKMLANYYALLEEGVISGNPEIEEEYNSGMLCMAIGRNSWVYWNGRPYANLAEAEIAYRQEIDLAASYFYDYEGDPMGSSLRFGTNSSFGTSFGH